MVVVIVNLIFLTAVIRHSLGPRISLSYIWPAAVAMTLSIYYFETRLPSAESDISWFTSSILTFLSLTSWWILWRSSRKSKGHGAQLMSVLFLLNGLNGLDRPLWPQSPFMLLRIAFDHLLIVSLGIAMVVLVLERARARTDELNDKLRRLSLITASSTQTLSVSEVLNRVLENVVASVGASHGVVRLLEGNGAAAKLVVHAAVGFDAGYLGNERGIAARWPGASRVLREDVTPKKSA